MIGVVENTVSSHVFSPRDSCYKIRRHEQVGVFLTVCEELYLSELSLDGESSLLCNSCLSDITIVLYHQGRNCCSHLDSVSQDNTKAHFNALPTRNYYVSL